MYIYINVINWLKNIVIRICCKNIVIKNNCDNVINLFKNIIDKKHCKFTQLDIKEFYPSITEEMLNKALGFAGNYTKISKEDIPLIYHCRKSVIFQR